MPLPGSAPPVDAHFELLRTDYVAARDDERAYTSIQAVVASITVAILTGVANLVGEACWLNSNAKDCKHIPRYFLAATPTPPLAALAFMQVIGITATLRSYYLRGVEKELRAYSANVLSEFRTLGYFKSPSYVGLNVEATSMRRGRNPYRILALLIFLVFLFVFAGLTIFIATRLKGDAEWVMLLAYGTAFILLIYTATATTFGGLKTFAVTAEKFNRRRSKPLLSDLSDFTGRRSLPAYLLLPRPEDWSKWLFIPISFTLIAWSYGELHRWPHMITSVFITEYLVYSARYQWNDIRGLGEDAGHPHSAPRARLPAGASRRRKRFAVQSSLLVALLRLGLAVLLGWRLGELTAVCILTLLVLGIAGVYERLRTKEVLNYGKSSNQGWQPFPGRVAVAIWLTVGLGYVLRFLVGAYAAGAHIGTFLVAVGAFFSYALGVTFVLMTWVLEASSYCSRELQGYGRHWLVTNTDLCKKEHVGKLLNYLEDPKIDWHAQGKLEVDCGEISILKDEHRDFDALRALRPPWAISYVGAAAFAGPLGLLLGGRACNPAYLVISVVLSLVLSLDVLFQGVSGLLIGGCFLLDVSGLYSHDPKLVILSTTPWILVSGVHVGFSYSSYSQLKNFGSVAASQVRTLSSWVLRLICGPLTWGEIDSSPARRADTGV